MLSILISIIDPSILVLIFFFGGLLDLHFLTIAKIPQGTIASGDHQLLALQARQDLHVRIAAYSDLDGDHLGHIILYHKDLLEYVIGLVSRVTLKI